LCEIEESNFKLTLSLFLCKKCIEAIKNLNPLKLYTLLLGSNKDLIKIEIEEIKNGG
jgi:hypothetical protein